MTVASPLPPDTACPRCGGGFHCGVDDGHCACFGLRLGEDLKRELAERYPGQCLCLACLRELSGVAAPAAPRTGGPAA